MAQIHAGASGHGKLGQLKGALYDYLLGSGAFPQGTSLAQLGYTGGPLTPGPGPLLSQAFDLGGGLATSPEAQQRAGTLGQLMQMNPSFSADPALRERYLQQAVTDPAMQYFNNTVAPSIAARYGRGGNIGAAADVTARAGQDLAGQLAGTRAGILRGDEQQTAQSIDAARGQGLSAAGLSYNNQVGTLGLLGQLGTAQRTIQGQQNAGQLNEALLGQPFADPRLSLVGLLGSSQNYTPSVVGAPNTPGAGYGILGSLLSAFG
jgi:hypothetical protein